MKIVSQRLMLMKKQIIKSTVRSNARALSLLLCMVVLLTSVSVTFAWFGSTFENLNTVITMGEYSADISVYSADGTLVENKAAENGDSISFDNTRKLDGWSSGDVSAYYIYADNTGEIDIKAYLTFISDFISSDKNDKADYTYAKKHFAYFVSDITESAGESGGFKNFIKSNELPTAEYIVKNGSTFADDSKKLLAGEVKAGKNACYALYFCCYDLPNKFVSNSFSFTFKTSIITSQSGAPEEKDNLNTSKQQNEAFTVAPSDSTKPSDASKTEPSSSAVSQKSTVANKAEWVWKYNDSSHKTVKLTGYNGKAKSVIIPSIADGLLVTSLGSNLFENTTVEKAVIPGCIKSFEVNTFSSNLKKIEIQAKTSVNDKIYSSPFVTDGHAIYTSDMTALVRYLPMNVNGDFTLPADVTYIYDNAFYGCSNLKKVTMNNVDYLNSSTFAGSSIVDFNLCSDKVVKPVGSKVFGNANKVTIHVLKSMSTAYKSAKATRGYKVVNDIQVNVYENYPYTEIDGLKYVIMKNGSEYLGTKYTFGSNEFVIVTGFSSIPNDGNVIIPATIICDNKAYNVAAVAENAFKGCKDIKSVVLPSHKVTYSASTFANCSNLGAIQYGDVIPYDLAEDTNQ